MNGLSKIDVYVVNADGTGLVRLTNVGNLEPANTLAWTPDGTRIAFTTRLDINTISTDGAGVPVNLNNSTGSDDRQRRGRQGHDVLPHALRRAAGEEVHHRRRGPERAGVGAGPSHQARS